MGGVVADRAFSKGLSGTDRIVTYVPLASPHNGSSLARDLCGVGEVDPAYADLLRHVAGLLGQPDPTAEAICDMARIEPPRAARGVSTTRVRLVTDPLVLRRDHAAPYRDMRELLPVDPTEIEGHGGILRSAQARAIVQAAIATQMVPRDDRGEGYQRAAEAASHAAESALTAAHDAVGDLVWSGAGVARLISFARDLLDHVRDGIALAGPHVLSHLPTVGSERLAR
jgi:hypothetical protein